MFCGECGNELPEGAVFCDKCGTRTDNIPSGGEGRLTGRMAAPDRGSFGGSGAYPGDEQSGAARQGMDTEKKPGGKKTPVIILTAAAVLLAAVAGASLFLLLRGGAPDDGKVLEADGKTGNSSGNGRGAEEEEIPLYDIPDVNVIDIYAGNVTPAEKTPGITWDSTLFYWLEDVDQESQEDGYLARCQIDKTLLRNSQGGGLIQYEVYRDPETLQIYKIVAIEEEGDGLELTDYYYQDGIPNFIFAREDSVYTPTYATPDKTGERYYFAGNVMARWRVIRTPREIGEYTLTPSDVSYTQSDYFQEGEDIRHIYDETENRMLNAAYNTYNAILSQTGVGLVEGAVKDSTGAGVSGMTVDIRRKEDNVLLYRCATDEDGIFKCFVYLDDTECFLTVRGDETFKETTVYGISLAGSGLTGAYGSLVLHRTAGDEYPVHINVYTAEDVRSGGDGSLSRSLVPGTSVSLREGRGAYEGEVLRTLQAGEGGSLDTTLPSGTYTAQIDAPGYGRTFLEIRVDEGETSADSYVLPSLEAGTTGVVLTWEGTDADLDLTLFTPFWSTGGDMARVGGPTMDDGCGNRLLWDNSAGCEVVYVNTAQTGSYKVYVSDYTDSQAGNYAAGVLGTLDIHIYVYDEGGFVAEYTFPVGQTGVVWEVAEINGSRITPSQRVYSSVEGKDWWLENKEVWMAEEDMALLSLLNGGSDLGELMESLVHRCSDEDIKALLRGETEGIESFLGLDGAEMPAAVYLGYVWKNAPENWLELHNQVGNEYFLTEEQAEYLIYSVCGKRIDVDFSVYDRWAAPYIGFGTAAGDTAWDRLEHFSVERVNAGTWKVRAYDVLVVEYGPSRVVSRVCFTVVKNPAGCFGGYSLTGYEVEERADISWAKIYYDYLTTDPEGISIAADYGRGWSAGEYRWNLVYVDDDMIPEIYLEGPDYASGDLLLRLSDGKVVREWFSQFGGRYVPYTGMLFNHGGHMGGTWLTGYCLEKGEMTEQYDCGASEDQEIYMETLESIIAYEHYTIAGSEVTKEQFEETLNGYYEGLGSAAIDTMLSYFTGENTDFMKWMCDTQYESALKSLESIMRYGIRSY